MSEPRVLKDIIEEILQKSSDPIVVDFLKSFDIKPRTSKEEVQTDATELEDWLDNQDVMHLLHISPRTLQTLRSNGTLPYSRINNKIYYRRQDIQQILADNYKMNSIRYDYGKKR